MQTKADELSHESVLPADHFLNEAPLRARLVYIANQHGIALVHPSAARALEVAAEMLMTRLVRGMIEAAENKNLPAKDIPGFVKDAEHNWEREVRAALLYACSQFACQHARLYVQVGHVIWSAPACPLPCKHGRMSTSRAM